MAFVRFCCVEFCQRQEIKEGGILTSLTDEKYSESKRGSYGIAKHKSAISMAFIYSPQWVGYMMYNIHDENYPLLEPLDNNPSFAFLKTCIPLNFYTILHQSRAIIVLLILCKHFSYSQSKNSKYEHY